MKYTKPPNCKLLKTKRNKSSLVVYLVLELDPVVAWYILGWIEIITLLIINRSLNEI